MRVIANKATICDSRRLSQQQFVVHIFYQKIWRAACTSDYKLKPHSTKKNNKSSIQKSTFQPRKLQKLGAKVSVIPADHVTTEPGAVAKTSSTSNEIDTNM